MQFQYFDSVFIGRFEFFLQIVARDVVNKPVQHYPPCQLRDKGQIRDRLLRETWSTSLFSTTLSVNLEIKDRLETDCCARRGQQACSALPSLST